MWRILQSPNVPIAGIIIFVSCNRFGTAGPDWIFFLSVQGRQSYITGNAATFLYYTYMGMSIPTSLHRSQDTIKTQSNVSPI